MRGLWAFETCVYFPTWVSFLTIRDHPPSPEQDFLTFDPVPADIVIVVIGPLLAMRRDTAAPAFLGSAYRDSSRQGALAV